MRPMLLHSQTFTTHTNTAMLERTPAHAPTAPAQATRPSFQVMTTLHTMLHQQERFPLTQRCRQSTQMQHCTFKLNFSLLNGLSVWSHWPHSQAISDKTPMQSRANQDAMQVPMNCKGATAVPVFKGISLSGHAGLSAHESFETYLCYHLCRQMQ